MRLLTLDEIHRFRAEQDWDTLARRFTEHLVACGPRLPEVIASLSAEEQEKLVETLLLMVATDGVH
jgi:hypothetical protein